MAVAEIRAAVGTTVTQRTVGNQLLQEQFQVRGAVACISLTPSRCHLRRQWSQSRAHWRKNFRSVVFPDESRFCHGASNGRVLVRRITLALTPLLQSNGLYRGLTCYPDLRDHQICLQLITYGISFIGRQLQHHPQPALAVPVLPACIQNSGGYTGY
ncbi:transposable element Tc1 transposase [Trichonephila clavipes]|nr:transposable element Tc1 transposase [Trichonephila clavipes]